jgi:hypothetical protein
MVRDFNFTLRNSLTVLVLVNNKYQTTFLKKLKIEI